MKKVIGTAILLTASLAKEAFAHPGHGAPELSESPMHYLIEPFHAIPAGVAALLVFVAVRAWVSRKSKEN